MAPQQDLHPDDRFRIHGGARLVGEVHGQLGAEAQVVPYSLHVRGLELAVRGELRNEGKALVGIADSAVLNVDRRIVVGWPPDIGEIYPERQVSCDALHVGKAPLCK